MMRFAKHCASAGILAVMGLGAAPGLAQTPGTAFRDCRHCPEMIVVPAGWFTMGAPDDEPDRQS